MRLLHVGKFMFQEFIDDRIPAYAIVSHRWGEDEVSYQDFLQHSNKLQVSTKADESTESGDRIEVGDTTRTQDSAPDGHGWTKIAKACTLAQAAHIKWLWMDTCCIDKTSSAELSEAINSMFRWYQNCRVCYVFLPDVHDSESCECWAKEEPTHDIRHIDSTTTPFCVKQFKRSSWFFRSWTLQELLAPVSTIQFYNADFDLLGNSRDLVEIISDATDIPRVYLGGWKAGARKASEASIAQRLSWGSLRKASRGEDMAYALMGLVGVNMPLLYGEGSEKAFLRLQTEILASNEDETIFCWMHPKAEMSRYEGGVLARSARRFAFNPSFLPELNSNDSSHNSVTNKGLKIDVPLSQNRLSSTAEATQSNSTASFVEFNFVLPLSVLAHYGSRKTPLATAIVIAVPFQKLHPRAIVQSKRVLRARRSGQVLVKAPQQKVQIGSIQWQELTWVGAHGDDFELGDTYGEFSESRGLEF